MRYAISDIHGCPKTFLEALNQINFSKDDELFLLGDYVDRGPDSIGVLETIWRLQAEGYRLHCLRGNHEQMLLNEIARGENSGVIPAARFAEVARWMMSLEYHLETPGFFLVHAGLNFRHPDPLEDTYAMLWIRYWYGEIDREWLGDRILVHGHTPEPLKNIQLGIAQANTARRVCIDSGCSHSHKGMGYLTVLNLDILSGQYCKNRE